MSMGPIVIGIDGSSNGREACRFAAYLAAATDVEVVAVHVFEPLHWIGKVPPPVDFHSLKERISQRLAEEWCVPLVDSGARFTSRVVEGRPTDAMIQVADEVDAVAIMVGVRGNSVVKDLVSGSTAAELPHVARRPVVLVPPGSGSGY